MAIFDETIEIRERCKEVHCVDLGESFPTSICLQKSISIQPRTSLVKFARSPRTDHYYYYYYYYRSPRLPFGRMRASRASDFFPPIFFLRATRLRCSLRKFGKVVQEMYVVVVQLASGHDGNRKFEIGISSRELIRIPSFPT